MRDSRSALPLGCRAEDVGTEVVDRHSLLTSAFDLAAMVRGHLKTAGRPLRYQARVYPEDSGQCGVPADLVDRFSDLVHGA